jgi:hypothetical protein
MGLQFKIIVFVKMLFENKIWMANAQVVHIFFLFLQLIWNSQGNANNK